MIIQEILQQPDGSLPELNLYNQLDMIPYAERNVILSQLIKKLSQNGVVNLHGLDINLFAKYIIDDKLTIENINDIFSKVKSVENIYRMEKLLIDNNCTITKRNSQNGQYFFTAKYKV